ncbi:MAG TPA: hypothetical protein VG817_12725 [Gemmatimonadales bacterium]|nr:hypothetical protein [Gemmatimonadales bacterium]
MFRLRYASGEEAIFRSVEELALGLRSGIIGTDTYVLDSTAHVWQPLSHHPAYQQATTLAATLHSYGDLELEPVVTTPAPLTTPSGQQRAISLPSAPVYQMASISGGELEARRQQKVMIKAGIVAGAALIVALSGFMIWRERGRGNEQAESQAQVPPVPAPARRSTPSAAPSGSYWLSPGILASRREDAQARIDQALIDSSTHLWWEDLTALERLRSADSLRIELERLKRWRRLSNEHRTNSFTMLKLYQDTANLQVRNDQWSLLDVNDWRSRGAFVEGPLDALRVDSLLGGLQKLYELLLAQNGQYQLAPGRAEFTAHRARVEYQRLAGILKRHGGPTPPGERVSLPLQLLRQALDGPPLPPVAPGPEDR